MQHLKNDFIMEKFQKHTREQTLLQWIPHIPSTEIQVWSIYGQTASSTAPRFGEIILNRIQRRYFRCAFTWAADGSEDKPVSPFRGHPGRNHLWLQPGAVGSPHAWCLFHARGEPVTLQERTQPAHFGGFPGCLRPLCISQLHVTLHLNKAEVANVIHRGSQECRHCDVCLQWSLLRRRLLFGLCWNSPGWLNFVIPVGRFASTTGRRNLGTERQAVSYNKKVQSWPVLSPALGE